MDKSDMFNEAMNCNGVLVTDKTSGSMHMILIAPNLNPVLGRLKYLINFFFLHPLRLSRFPELYFHARHVLLEPLAGVSLGQLLFFKQNII
jgi:hypothetical protein